MFFTINLCFAQNVNQLVKKSIESIKNNDISTFDKTYQKIWNEYLKENIPNYKNAIKETQNKQYNFAIKSIDSLIQDDYFIDDILKDKNFSILHQEKNWQRIQNKLNTIKSGYNNTIRKKLLEIRNKDQGIRLIILDVRRNSNDSLLNKKINNKMKLIDHESAIIVSKIIDKYGWLGKDKIGSEANQTLFLGIQHIDDIVVQNKYLPILKEAVKKGNSEPWNLAFLTDRILMNQGKKQIYGTQTIVSKDPKLSYIVPLQNPEKVDELRKEIGLEPLNDYLKDDGLSWNIDEYKNDLPRIEKLYKERFERQKK